MRDRETERQKDRKTGETEIQRGRRDRETEGQRHREIGLQTET
jgi:hypothetical protein